MVWLERRRLNSRDVRSLERRIHLSSEKSDLNQHLSRDQTRPSWHPSRDQTRQSLHLSRDPARQYVSRVDFRTNISRGIKPDNLYISRGIKPDHLYIPRGIKPDHLDISLGIKPDHLIWTDILTREMPTRSWPTTPMVRKNWYFYQK